VLTAPGLRSLFLGSSLLILAHVHVERTSFTENDAADNLALMSGSVKHVAQKSDDLMKDLEHELGETWIEYMSVKMVYNHSAFQENQVLDAQHGVLAVSTKLETTASAVIQHRNPRSMWSPRCTPPANSPFEIVASS
jgi:hypothetical protein